MNELHTASGPEAPVHGPTLWHGEELAARGDWDHHLTDENVRELEQAIDAIKSRGLDIIDITRDDFTLPGLSPLLERIRADVVDGSGVAMLRGLPVERWSREQSAIAYWGINTYIGQAVSQNPQGHMLGHVKDLGEDAADVNTRGYRSHAALPFHTDLGAEIVVLLCLKASKTGGLSSIVSASAIHNKVLKEYPELMADLADPWYIDRRGELLPGMKPYYAMPIFNYLNDRLYVCYVKPYVETAQRFEGVPPLTQRQCKALEIVRDLANSEELKLDISFNPGDIQFVNNLTTLHARTEYEDFDDPAEKRHLLRLWLTTPDALPLPKPFYERYGTSQSNTRPMGVNPQDGKFCAPLEAS